MRRLPAADRKCYTLSFATVKGIVRKSYGLLPNATACYTARVSRQQFNVRVEADLLAKLDGWLKDMNRARRVKLKRSDLVRAVLGWAVDVRPDVEAMPGAVPEAPAEPATAPRYEADEFTQAPPRRRTLEQNPKGRPDRGQR